MHSKESLTKTKCYRRYLYKINKLISQNSRSRGGLFHQIDFKGISPFKGRSQERPFWCQKPQRIQWLRNRARQDRRRVVVGGKPVRPDSGPISSLSLSGRGLLPIRPRISKCAFSPSKPVCSDAAKFPAVLTSIRRSGKGGSPPPKARPPMFQP